MKSIKVPTPRQLPSGSWFIQLSVNGQRISVTEKTEKACIARAMAIKQDLLEPVDRSQKPPLTVAIDRYIEDRKNVLSPSTILGYRIIQRNRFQSAMGRPVDAYDEAGWQRLVNIEAKLCSAKTLTNAFRFISSVIYAETGKRYRPKLPQIVSEPRQFLEPEQISVFVEKVAKTKYAIPAMLALCSLRRSEILALTWDNIDLKAGTIKVQGSVVRNEDMQYVYKKENKTASSRRTVPIMIPQLKDALASVECKTGNVVQLLPNAIRNGINKVCRENDLPEVGIHGLRHSFASLAYHIGMPEKVAMQIGGWENDATMKKIYTHVAKSDVLKYQNLMTDFFSSSHNFTNGITNGSKESQ